VAVAHRLQIVSWRDHIRLHRSLVKMARLRMSLGALFSEVQV
jgi:hypothetical protein